MNFILETIALLDNQIAAMLQGIWQYQLSSQTNAPNKNTLH